YLLKEQFMDFVKASSSVEAESKLNRWLNLVKQHKIKEFYYLANTIVNWKTEILNSFDVPYSNGCIEGYNNKIKVIKRNAFGFRNFNRFRLTYSSLLRLILDIKIWRQVSVDTCHPTFDIEPYFLTCPLVLMPGPTAITSGSGSTMACESRRRSTSLSFSIVIS
ncbi:Transposase, partial [Desulforamulus hydrothermalis Lam5 = DSM 18033]